MYVHDTAILDYIAAAPRWRRGGSDAKAVANGVH